MDPSPEVDKKVVDVKIHYELGGSLIIRIFDHTLTKKSFKKGENAEGHSLTNVLMETRTTY